MPKVFTSKSQKIGELGEEIACKYLISKGFRVLERNYTKKWGEIDIIASRDRKTYFIEVKAVSCVTLPEVSQSDNTSPRASGRPSPNLGEGRSLFRPEENMHPMKVRKFLRTIQTYLIQRKIEGEWQADLYCVYIQLESRKARVTKIENIIG